MATTVIGVISDFIKTHERLIIVVLCLIFAGWIMNKGLNIYQGYEQGKLTNLQQQLDETKQQTATAQQSAQDAKNAAATTAAQAAQDKATSVAMISALSQQNTSLTNQIAQRDKQTQQQQTTDLSATIPELGKRFETLIPNVNPTDIDVAANGKTVTIGQDTAEKAVSQLELVPSLQADNSSLEQQVKNGQDMLASSQKALNSQSSLTDAQQKVITAQDTYATLLETQLKQSDATCQAQINVEKANTKKAFLKGFKWGAVVGFIGGIFTGHAL